MVLYSLSRFSSHDLHTGCKGYELRIPNHHTPSRMSILHSHLRIEGLCCSRPLGQTNCRLRDEGWSAMRALIKTRVLYLSILILGAVSISPLLAIMSPSSALARTRPSVELGDPDGTGDQGSVPGLRNFAADPTSTNLLRPINFPQIHRTASSSHSSLLILHLMWRYVWPR